MVDISGDDAHLYNGVANVLVLGEAAAFDGLGEESRYSSR